MVSALLFRCSMRTGDKRIGDWISLLRPSSSPSLPSFVETTTASSGKFVGFFAAANFAGEFGGESSRSSVADSAGSPIHEGRSTSELDGGVAGVGVGDANDAGVDGEGEEGARGLT